MKKSTKSKSIKSKRKTLRFKNPDVFGAPGDGYGFQDVRFHLAYVAGLEEGFNVGGAEEDKIYHLMRALEDLSERGTRNSIFNYQREIMTPEVKKKMAEFAKALRKSLIEVADEYGIDSYQGLLITSPDRT